MFETFINHNSKRRNFTGHVELNQATYFLSQAGETVSFNTNLEDPWYHKNTSP